MFLDMHAAVEEVDLDPCDLYTDLGSLIIEGRVSGLTDRGFGEGPHCPSPHGQNRHQCDPSSPECQKYEQVLKHMLLLWKNCIPMTIEVLLYPSCCAPSQNVESIPELSYLLLEQWTIHMLPRRVPDASISPRGLIQAVRSFLYFSQLCAWFSLSGGRSPQNVHYRVCVPGEAFSSKFSSQPDCHIFPVTNIGRSAAMKVMMKSHPRCGEIPCVPCLKHSQSYVQGKKCVTGEQSDEVREYPLMDGILSRSRTNSPADSMLGESLLDPPNSLCMYPKRYQSPSRCGSPSIEVPEHLMFGKSNPKKPECPPRRSRPQRRPVVERFLKSYQGDEAVDSDVQRTNVKKLGTVDPFLLKSDNVLNYCCIDEDVKNVSRKEMEQVLERLRERQMGIKSNSSSDIQKDFTNKSLSQLVEEMQISPNLDKNQEYKKSLFSKNSDILDSKALFKQALKFNKDSSNSRPFYRTAKPLKTFEIGSEPHKYTGDSQNGHSTSQTLHNFSLANKLHVHQSFNYSLHNKNNINLKNVPESISQAQKEKNSINILSPYQNDRTIPSHLHPRNSSVNIKKCGSLLSDDNLDDEREISSASFVCPTDDEVFQNPSAIIPSAEKKALFRRSLDSATSLVFHQRSGLPLTSSPAPIRKSGTCFDFDSSLTSVSAIKRALFEKEPDEDRIQKDILIHFSNNAPSSIVNSSLLGTFEESVLNGRLEPVSTVEGFTAEIGASGSFCPRHIVLPVTVFFYTLQNMDKVTSPYMGHINLKNKDYHVPKKGTVQITLFNPHRTVVKMFVVRYDLSDMPVNSQTFLRQRTLYMPVDASENDEDAQKWLRYLIHLRFMSSKSGRVYLHTDIRVIIFRKCDLDAATVHGQRPYELRTITHGPLNPKFSSHKP